MEITINSEDLKRVIKSALPGGMDDMFDVLMENLADELAQAHVAHQDTREKIQKYLEKEEELRKQQKRTGKESARRIKRASESLAVAYDEMQTAAYKL